jgi:hypothetical protein
MSLLVPDAVAGAATYSMSAIDGAAAAITYVHKAHTLDPDMVRPA